MIRIIKRPDATTIPHVITERCRVCRECVARQQCLPKAIVIVDRGEPPWIDASRCQGCRTCTLACPYGAITLDRGTQ